MSIDNHHDNFEMDLEKRKIMSEILEIAINKIKDLRDNNYQFKSDIGVGTKKFFSPEEFQPKELKSHALLGRVGILQALGIDADLKLEDAPVSKQENGETKGIWPTIIPGLSYVLVRNINSSIPNGYFSLDDSSTDSVASAESLGDWNKRMWSQADADKKSHEELNEMREDNN